MEAQVSEVTQEDREAAALLMEDQKPLWNEHIDDIRAGNNDGNAIVQAFAARAEAAVKAEREAVIGYLRSYHEDGLADAIASGEHEVKHD